jgi:hypothetical protein
VGALYTPRTAVLHPAEGRARPAPAALRRPVPAPRFQHPILRGFALRGINEGSSNSPVRSSPRPQRPGWNERRFGFPLRLPHPADRSRRRTPRAGTGRRARTWNYTLNITSVDPPIGSSLVSCDLASHRPFRQRGRVRMHLFGARRDSRAAAAVCRRVDGASLVLRNAKAPRRGGTLVDG